jgi:hypothetical protein
MRYIPPQGGFMRRKIPFHWPALALAIVLFSTVLSQSGGYTLPWWTADNGGVTFSTGGNYSLSGTFGQPDAGNASGGAYVLKGGFWSANSEVAVITPTPARISYMPYIVRALPPPTVPPPVSCNEQEDNAGKNNADPFPGIGKTCYGDFYNPAEDDDDWYSINLSAGQNIEVRLTGMQAGDDYLAYLYLPNGTTIVKSGASFTYVVPANGLYYIQLFAFAKGANPHSYYLAVTLQ